LKAIKVLFLSLCFILLISSLGYAADIRDTVLKVFVTANRIDFYRPWQSQGSSGKTGSACIIEGNRILTNAHVVSDHTFVQVKKDSDPKKYTAKLLAIAHDCDLALLEIDDPEFFKGIKPLELGGLPRLQETVTVIGYPTGGDKISITEGVISRLEITPYVQSSRKLLTVQIDAAINSGNSGGPVIQDSKLVGIAMQGISDSQSIGYMIPVPIIKHFLKDLEDDEYDGFPALGIDIQNTENKALRKYFNIQGKEGGVHIAWVMPNTAAYGNLKEDDVLLKLDGTPIGVDGTFKFRENERLSLSYLITQKQMGDKILVEFVRDGKLKNKKIKLGAYSRLVYPFNAFEKPSYYIYGGFVFTVLSSDLLQSWGKRWWQQAPVDFLYSIFGTGGLNRDEKKEIVVLLQVLPDETNVGYHRYRNEVISKINGKEFDSFKEFVEILNTPKDQYTIIETKDNDKVILYNEKIDEINKKILKRNHISSQYSEDVGKWLGKTSE